MNKIYKCFPDGKHKVLTMSYDDGKVYDRRLVKLFNSYGIKGTFHLNSALMKNEERIPESEIKELYKGHEVAIHTCTHPTIARCPEEQIVEQVIEDRKVLEGIMGYTVRGMSYPNGSYNDSIKELLPHLGIEYSRVVEDTGEFTLPDDFYEWKATCHHDHNLMKHAEEFAALFKKQYLYMMYVWGHAYDFVKNNNWDLIEKFCEYIGNREDIWYATNIEIVDYFKAAENLKFSASGNFVYNPSAMSVWLSVNDDIVEVKGGVQTELFK